MNTIPSVGPDTAIAPRTGSGSPQTPSQQRADAAPSVLSDNPSAAADPGVMLKITPPVQSRQGDSKVSEQTQDRALNNWSSLIDGADVRQVIALTGSANEADEAIQGRVTQAFAALPADIQEAIRLASTPAIAKLLRLAAITSPGIKEAPAVVQSGTAPLANGVDEAVAILQQLLRQAPPFKLAQLLQELAGIRVPQMTTVPTPQERANQAMTTQSLHQGFELDSQQTQLLRQLQFELGKAGGQGAQDVQSRQQVAQLLQLSSEHQAQGQSTTQRAAQSEQQLFEGPMGQQIGQSSSSAHAPRSAADIKVGNLTVPGPSAFAADDGQGDLAGSHLGAQPVGILGGQVVSSGSLPQHTEAVVRDGLRLLMDGRMLWQGQFTPGVPMQFERSDAWRTNRRSLGGMEKGASLKVKLQLPNIGPLEVRAMGFGGQVSVRLHADSAIAPTVASALPELQKRLRDRGLAGTQVLVDSL